MILLNLDFLEQKKDSLDKTVFEELQKNASAASETKIEKILDFSGFLGISKNYYSLAPYYHPTLNTNFIKQDGIYNQESTKGPKDAMARLSGNALALALAGYFIDKKYSEQAIFMLSAWFLGPDGMNPNLTYAQAIPGNKIGRPAGIIDVHNWINIIIAIDLISLVIEDEKFMTGMRQWFGALADWLHTSDNSMKVRNIGNNIEAWRMSATLVFSLFSTGRDKTVNACCDEFKEILESKTDERGCFITELNRTRSLHYNLFFLDAMSIAAEAAHNQGIDLWHYISPNKKSIEKSFDFLAPFLKDEHWPYPQIPQEFHKQNSFYLAGKRLKRPDFIETNQRLADNTPNSHLGPSWLWRD